MKPSLSFDDPDTLQARLDLLIETFPCQYGHLKTRSFVELTQVRPNTPNLWRCQTPNEPETDLVIPVTFLRSFLLLLLLRLLSPRSLLFWVSWWDIQGCCDDVWTAIDRDGLCVLSIYLSNPGYRYLVCSLVLTNWTRILSKLRISPSRKSVETLL